MKIFCITFSFLLMVAVTGCRKEEKVDFEFNRELDYMPTELDNWLTTAFTDPYNIEVVYRFDRYKGAVDQNLVPAGEDKVKEQMRMVLNGYLMPYEIAGGRTFIKRFAPKEWVLFGSYSIQSDGSRVLATSGGGRNITLYEVNAINSADPEAVRPRLKTIHHEFTHTLSQIQRLPLEFENISRADYTESWRNATLYPDKDNDSLGFVSRYARANVMEDFAETAGFLLANGQLWYDNKAGKVPKSGYDILKKKESAVVNYFRDQFGVDFRKLQREVAFSMYNDFNDKNSQTFEYWFFNQGLFDRSLGYNTANVSPDVKNAVDNFKAAVNAYSASARYVVQDLTYIFTPANATAGTLVVSVPFRSGTSPIIYADYNFTYTQDPVTHSINFVKAAQGTGPNYTNANFFMASFMTNISGYLTGSSFRTDWSVNKPDLSRRDEAFFNSGGFYKAGDRTSYLNFQLLKVRK
ncbi:substrate import-associated zinc metallohydrolase lipoprotein [Chitinophaga varians]|uniref:substrate import-associated zinc metallohydrolase lipoprotein n=1 Tax=Chitinophaga varians TaxID=2202339 RepID=UPI00165F81F0|nr:substrate import-associated zinc metallohydrolase lipoprotein [Chitinophaga varians]MBC9909152.1 hypothetical protein [Chitinophaga varians]